MINRLEIENFRGFEHLVLDHLCKVNLLVGGNDTGKTSALEALVLLLGNEAALRALPVTFRTNQTAGNSTDDINDRENFWSWLFYDRDENRSLSITAQIDAQQSVKISTKRLENPNYPGGQPEPVLIRRDSRKRDSGIPRPGAQGGEVHLVRFGQHQFQLMGDGSPEGFRVAVLSTRPTNPVLDAENYNHVALLAEGEHRVENIMRDVEPRLRRLRYAKLPRTTTPLIFADIGLSRAVPSTQMGQAFNRILHIYTQVLAHQTNVLLIDEIENGIFSESLVTVWRGLIAICEQEDVQIFATTHSRECVMAAQSVAQERNKDELCVQRLQFVKGKVEAVRLGLEHLELAAEMGLEVRS